MDEIVKLTNDGFFCKKLDGVNTTILEKIYPYQPKVGEMVYYCTKNNNGIFFAQKEILIIFFDENQKILYKKYIKDNIYI